MRQCMDADNLHRRLKKIIGQLNAIDRMVDEDVPCEEMLMQINAAKSALHKVGQVVLEGCPRLRDVDASIAILRYLGCIARWEGDSLVVDIGKSNKMFRVERPGGNMREFLRASRHLSDYIRDSVAGRGQSVWIAQRNGRTKDGIDRTDQGIINMFRASGTGDMAGSIAGLNIVPVSVSYEWEPCDILKTVELYARQSGPYIKKPGEDIESILTGIRQPKGRVHFSICKPVTEHDLDKFRDLRPNDFNRQVATLIDRRICSSYRLYPGNWVAHDILSGTGSFHTRYTESDKAALLRRMSLLDSCPGDADVLRSIFLGIYAGPVDSAAKFSGNDETDS